MRYVITVDSTLRYVGVPVRRFFWFCRDVNCITLHSESRGSAVIVRDITSGIIPLHRDLTSGVVVSIRVNVKASDTDTITRVSSSILRSYRDSLGRVFHGESTDSIKKFPKNLVERFRMKAD